jgi:casein kinase 1
MAKRYKDPKTQVHISYRENVSPAGTPRYMSINAHLGREQSRRDDLEALCYVWLYFLTGSLPWQGMKAPTNEIHERRIREKKQDTTVEDLCTGFPVEFAECLRYVRHLGFDDEPNYGYLQNLFSRVLEGAGEVDDGKFDWLKAGEERPRLEIRPPRTSDSAAAPGKRLRAASVPDQGEIRGRKPPAILHNIAEEEEPKDCGSG